MNELPRGAQAGKQAKLAPRICLVHAVGVSIEPCARSFAVNWREARCSNLLDESLAQDLLEDGSVTDRIIRRFLSLGAYCADLGADAILFTCSAFGVAIDAVKAAHAFPVLSPYEALFDDIIGRGGKVALLTTFPPSGVPMQKELSERAAERNVRLEIQHCFVPGALDALMRKDQAAHDALIVRMAASIQDAQSIALGQFSMSSALQATQQATRIPVFSTPDSAVTKLKRYFAEPDGRQP